MNAFKPGDKVRVIVDPGMGVREGRIGTVEKPSREGSSFVRVTFSEWDRNVPYRAHELELAE